MKTSIKASIFLLSTVILTIGILYLIAVIKVNSISKNFNKIQSKLNSANCFRGVKSIDDTISYLEVKKFHDLCKTSIDGLEYYQSKNANLKLAKIFLKERSINSTIYFDYIIKANKVLLDYTIQPLIELDELNEKVANLDYQYQYHKKSINDYINIYSDIENYRSYQKDIQNLTIRHKEGISEINDIIKSKTYTNKSDTISRWILNGFNKKLEYEFLTLNNDKANLGKIQNSLNKQKAELISIVINKTNLYYQIQQIVNDYGPIVSNINTRLDPLEELIDYMGEPIPGSDFYGMTSVLSGGTRKNGISTMDILSSIYPGARKAIETIKEICNTLTELDNEIKEINEVTTLYLNSIQDYLNNKSRLSIIDLVDKSVEFSSYLDSKKDIFDPYKYKIDRARYYLYEIRNTIYKIEIQEAKSYVNRFFRLADIIIDYAYTPFNIWKQNIDRISLPLYEIQKLEVDYLSYLKSYNSDIEIRKTINNDLIREAFNSVSEDELKPIQVDNETLEIKPTTKKDNIRFEYIAKLSNNDHYSSSGLLLKDAGAIIQQDRANVHRFNKQDPEDQADNYFTTVEKRSEITNYTNKYKFASRINNTIINNTPLVKVKVHVDGKIDVEIID